MFHRILTYFVNEKSFETSNFYGQLEIHKSKIIEVEIHSQNTELVKVWKPSDLKLRPIVGRPHCPTRRISYSSDTFLKPYLKHLISYIQDSVDFFNKYQGKEYPDTEILTFDVTNYTLAFRMNTA